MAEITVINQIPDQGTEQMAEQAPLKLPDPSQGPGQQGISPQGAVKDSPPGKRRSHLFQPGQSGNPSGRPKRTQEEKDALEAIRTLAPLAAVRLKELLNSDRISPAILVRVCELVFDRTYGRAEAAVKVTSAAETVEQSRDYVLALVEAVREERQDE